MQSGLFPGGGTQSCYPHFGPQIRSDFSIFSFLSGRLITGFSISHHSLAGFSVWHCDGVWRSGDGREVWKRNE